jgi:hypothetical protein
MKADSLSQFDNERHLQTQSMDFRFQSAAFRKKKTDLFYELAVLRHGLKSMIRYVWHLCLAECATFFKQWRQLSNVVAFVAAYVDNYARGRVRGTGSRKFDLDINKTR